MIWGVWYRDKQRVSGVAIRGLLDSFFTHLEILVAISLETFFLGGSRGKTAKLAFA